LHPVFAEVLPDKVTVLAETAERPEEINVERARQAKERAEQWWLAPTLNWTWHTLWMRCVARKYGLAVAGKS